VGVPVLGHVGLTPQTASALGGYRTPKPAAIRDAAARYAAEVRDGSFPGEGKSFAMNDELLKKLYGT
jgi:ketopantoate hydroxymethyltransferase